MKLTVEAQELLDLGPDPANIAEALEGVELVLRGFEWNGRGWNLTGAAERMFASVDAGAAFSRLVSARDGLRSVLNELGHG
jgi:hypothetical protein